MKKFIKENNGVKTEFEFFLSGDGGLDDNLPVSTPITFAFIGQNLILLEKDNDWWDVPGGKIESGETWKNALKREALEEAGILIDDIDVVGYIKAKNSGESKFDKENILPVTISFVKEVKNTPLASEVVQRQALKRSEAKELLNKRGDNGQLSEVFDYVIDFYDSQNYEYEFEYFEGENKNLLKLPKTQAMVFVEHKKNTFFAVRDFDEKHYSLPGGGCYMDETDEGCARREVREEAQCDIVDIKLLGTVVVRVKKKGKILSESRQLRYLAKSKNVEHFIPEEDGSEVIERREVDLDFLANNTKILNNETGKNIIKDLKYKL